MSECFEEILSLEREGGLSVNPDEIWIHGKEILMNQILLLIYYFYYIDPNVA